MDFPAVITRVKDLKPLSISDFGSVNLNGVVRNVVELIVRR